VARFWATKRSEFSSTPSFREAQGHPPKADQVTGAPFLLVRFLWARKENEQTCYAVDQKNNSNPPKDLTFEDREKFPPQVSRRSV
jgi:hypothetical protein